MADLHDYNAKRDFGVTPEPAGSHRPTNGRKRTQTLSFVVQKHDARHLHYDFRLELDGVLLSWAVPKGPSLDPKTKRLAVETEPHPLDYAHFEGVIPKGQYGGGTVMVWDRGTWQPEGDPRQGYESGHLKFTLAGAKLGGKWHLVRRGEERNWLLFKARDAAVKEKSGLPITQKRPESAKTGRSLAEIAERRDAVGQGHEVPRVDGRAPRSTVLGPSALAGARKGRVSPIGPQLATLVDRVPTGDAWIHETKYDGYRVLVHREGKSVRCLTRSGKDWTDRMPFLADAVMALPVESVILDGELCALRAGQTDFQSLQNTLSQASATGLVYYAFDLLAWEGWDLRRVALSERKDALAELLGTVELDPIRYSDHVRGSGPEFYEVACENGLEGIISKRASSAYSSRRGRDWLKIKCARRQEVLIGGYTDPSGSRQHLGALLVGVHDERGRLTYRGKVGTGFTRQTLRDLHEKLLPLERRQPPFSNPPRESRGVHWLEPQLVAEVEFAELTTDGRFRHPRFKGLRQDKPPKRITMETTQALVQEPPRGAASASVELPSPITHPNRILYAEQGTTKRQLAEYYVRMARWMLPHVANRPLTLVRCPEGQAKECFFQKHVTKGMPDAIKESLVMESGKPARYITVQDTSGLVALVQIGTLEVHTWGARADRLDRPDQLVFDLDPGEGVEWGQVADAALTVRAVLAELGLESFLKTTGGKGLHVTVPVDRRTDWSTTKAFCKNVSEAICRVNPERYVCVMTKAKRRGRIFIDYLRNGRGATSIAPFSTRARPGAPVATPLAWDELSHDDRPRAYTIETQAARCARLSQDPWIGYFDVRQSITSRALRAAGVGG